MTDNTISRGRFTPVSAPSTSEILRRKAQAEKDKASKLRTEQAVLEFRTEIARIAQGNGGTLPKTQRDTYSLQIAQGDNALKLALYEFDTFRAIKRNSEIKTIGVELAKLRLDKVSSESSLAGEKAIISRFNGLIAQTRIDNKLIGAIALAQGIDTVNQGLALVIYPRFSKLCTQAELDDLITFWPQVPVIDKTTGKQAVDAQGKLVTRGVNMIVKCANDLIILPEFLGNTSEETQESIDGRNARIALRYAQTEEPEEPEETQD